MQSVTCCHLTAGMSGPCLIFAEFGSLERLLDVIRVVGWFNHERPGPRGARHRTSRRLVFEGAVRYILSQLEDSPFMGTPSTSLRSVAKMLQ